MTRSQKMRNEEIMARYIGTVETGRVFVLIDMARRGETPDGSFTDDECSIWDELMNLAKYPSV